LRFNDIENVGVNVLGETEFIYLLQIKILENFQLIIMISDEEQGELKKAQTDKELKRIFKKITSKKPDDYFPTKELRNLGYMRKQCKCCQAFFWTTREERKVCGDPACSGGFQVVIEYVEKLNPSLQKKEQFLQLVLE